MCQILRKNGNKVKDGHIYVLKCNYASKNLKRCLSNYNIAKPQYLILFDVFVVNLKFYKDSTKGSEGLR